MTLKRVLIMAGGTGGHVFPGLAVAAYLREQGVEVHWMGTERGIEARLVPKQQFPLHQITIEGVRGKGWRTLLASPYRLSSAIWQAMQIIKQIKPEVVVGLGGFVSGPGGIASRLLRIPLIVHEQNAKAGLTNQMLAHFAKQVLEGFPNTFRPQKKVHYIGNPVRPEIIDIQAPALRYHPERRLRLLIVGGSLGAKALNELVPEAIAQLPAGLRPEIWHQSGERSYQETNDHYQRLALEAIVSPFIDEMAKAYTWADLVICRAGALTVSELCAAGVAAIFVPYPYAVDDHQTANADFLVKHKAALCMQQATLTPGLLTRTLSRFATDRAACLQMAQAAYQLRKTNVTEQFFAIIAQTAKP